MHFGRRVDRGSSFTAETAEKGGRFVPAGRLPLCLLAVVVFGLWFALGPTTDRASAETHFITLPYSSSDSVSATWDYDYYEFAARVGDLIVVDVAALGTEDATVELWGPSDILPSASDDTWASFGMSAHLSFTADVAGTWEIRVEPALLAQPPIAYSIDAMFLYRPPVAPVVTSVAPNRGATSGGTVVNVTGTDLNGAIAVKFGNGSYAWDFTANSSTSITATAPTHAAGIVDVMVVTSVGTSSTTGSGNDYTYDASLPPIPYLESISPNFGPTGGGNTVTISGVYLLGVTSVTFGGAPATILSKSEYQMTVRVPAHTAGLVNVVLSAPGGTNPVAGTENDYAYIFIPEPAVTALSPTSGPTTGGAGVIITGTDFTGATAVSFGSIAATGVTVVNPSTITCTSPAHSAGTVDVTVTTPGGTSSISGTGNDYAYFAPTRYDQTDPNIAKTGVWSDYASTGSHLGSYGRSSTAGATATVWFSGTKIAWIGMKGSTPGIVDVYVDDLKKATLDLSAYPAAYQQTLWTSGTFPEGTHHLDLVRSSASASTEYLVLDAVDIWGNIEAAPPTITSLSPASGSTLGGTSVTINGGGFSDVSSVTFDGASVPYTFVSSTKITVTAPAHAEGTVPVQVTTSAGTASSTFTYAVAPPTTRTDVKKTTTVITTGTTWSGTWASYTSASAFSGSYMRSSTAGAYVLIVFKGTRLDWIAMKGTSTGIADVYVDGSATKAATVDLRATVASYQQNVWTSGPLANGYHTVKIVRSPSSATGKYLTIDAIDIAGTLVSTTPSSATRIEENATPAQSLFLWSPDSPSWIVGKSSSASGGTYRYTNTAGASVTINFTGPSISLLAKTASNFGNITVTLDGVAKTVSLYSPAVLYQKMVYSSGFLTPGNHTLVIVRAGTKSSSSTGYTVDIDAIYLIGELR